MGELGLAQATGATVCSAKRDGAARARSHPARHHSIGLFCSSTGLHWMLMIWQLLTV
jgi:hypothetical protein